MEENRRQKFKEFQQELRNFERSVARGFTDSWYRTRDEMTQMIREDDSLDSNGYFIGSHIPLMPLMAGAVLAYQFSSNEYSDLASTVTGLLLAESISRIGSVVDGNGGIDSDSFVAEEGLIGRTRRYAGSIKKYVGNLISGEK